MLKKRKINISEDQRKKCHAIIHSHAVACGGIGTGLAQIPLMDNAVMTPIQIAMIIELGTVFNQEISKSVAQSILSGAAAMLIGRGISQALWGWVPVLGNAINTATASGLTEAIGWMAVDRFSKERFCEDVLNEKETDDNEMTVEEESADDEKEYVELNNAAEQFLNGEKSYNANKAEYDNLMLRFEQVIRNLPKEHELRSIYDKLSDLSL